MFISWDIVENKTKINFWVSARITIQFNDYKQTRHGFKIYIKNNVYCRDEQLTDHTGSHMRLVILKLKYMILFTTLYFCQKFYFASLFFSFYIYINGNWINQVWRYSSWIIKNFVNNSYLFQNWIITLLKLKT